MFERTVVVLTQLPPLCPSPSPPVWSPLSQVESLGGTEVHCTRGFEGWSTLDAPVVHDPISVVGGRKEGCEGSSTTVRPKRTVRRGRQRRLLRGVG